MDARTREVARLWALAQPRFGHHRGPEDRDPVRLGRWGRASGWRPALPLFFRHRPGIVAIPSIFGRSTNLPRGRDSLHRFDRPNHEGRGMQPVHLQVVPAPSPDHGRPLALLLPESRLPRGWQAGGRNSHRHPPLRPRGGPADAPLPGLQLPILRAQGHPALRLPPASGGGYLRPPPHHRGQRHPQDQPAGRRESRDGRPRSVSSTNWSPFPPRTCEAQLDEREVGLRRQERGQLRPLRPGRRSQGGPPGPRSPGPGPQADHRRRARQAYGRPRTPGPWCETPTGGPRAA